LIKKEKALEGFFFFMRLSIVFKHRLAKE